MEPYALYVRVSALIEKFILDHKTQWTGKCVCLCSIWLCFISGKNCVATGTDGQMGGLNFAFSVVSNGTILAANIQTLPCDCVKIYSSYM